MPDATTPLYTVGKKGTHRGERPRWIVYRNGRSLPLGNVPADTYDTKAEAVAALEAYTADDYGPDDTIYMTLDDAEFADEFADRDEVE